MSEVNERSLPKPDLGSDYRTFRQGLLNQEIKKNTIILLDREGIGADKKEFKLEMDVPHELIHLLRLRSKRDSYYGSIADLLTITKDCQTKFVISHVSASNKDGENQPVSLSYSYQLISEVKSKVVGSYSLIIQQGKSPKVEFKVKKGLRYKNIPKWVFKMEWAGNRDFEIIRDTTDFIAIRNNPRMLHEKEFVEHQRQITGDRYVDDYSQEARKIETKARARVLKDWPEANTDNLNN